MIITNKLGLPEGLVKACSTEMHNAPGSLSATTLLKGVKEIILTERHWEELEEDASGRVWAVFGQAVHALMEHEGENDFTEEKLSWPMEGITITGRIDNYNMAARIISDYKTMSATKIFNNEFHDWEAQGLIYAWLLRNNGFKAEQCRFIGLIKDHSKRKARYESGYPNSPVFIFEFDVTDEKIAGIEAYITAVVRAYKNSRALTDDAVEPCSAKQRYEKIQYAVMREGRKRAAKLFDTEADALAYAAEGQYVEKRGGESNKCLYYCPCAKFCNFYKSLISEGGENG
jgi:hypothetical protein